MLIQIDSPSAEGQQVSERVGQTHCLPFSPGMGGKEADMHWETPVWGMTRVVEEGPGMGRGFGGSCGRLALIPNFTSVTVISLILVPSVPVGAANHHL